MTITAPSAPRTNTDVQMGDVVIVRGARYTIADEPTYVRAYGNRQMIQWELEPVFAGLASGTLRGAYRVWPDEDSTVIA